VRRIGQASPEVDAFVAMRSLQQQHRAEVLMLRHFQVRL
jgi:hypothetical protein